MTQTLLKTLTFEEFVEWMPEDKRFELHDGEIIEVAQPTGEHEKVIGVLAKNITVEFVRLDRPYFIPSKVLVKPEGKKSGYFPDVLVLDETNLQNEPLYKKESTVSQSATIPLVIEVVSTNWSVDYALKFDEYSDIGILEYWIVDYLGIGGKEFTGIPKQPTFTVCQLENGQYKRTFLRSGKIQSKVFPELNLTVEQVFQAGAAL
ncbi:MAG: Uma2 family endonuclease [Richelia sp. RM2_1_2]|nr:Uma2 family endonuclease [Richelia sp. RM2_1_2]